MYHRHTFTFEDSQRIIEAAEQRGLNVNHLTHAALFLALLRIHPPSSSESRIASHIAVDDRRILQGRFAPGQEPFFGNCHGHGSIRVDEIQQYTLPSSAGNKAIYSKLEDLARKLKAEYTKTIKEHCRVSAGVAFMETLAKLVSRYMSLLQNVELYVDRTACRPLRL